jgi:hypothetical protein
MPATALDPAVESIGAGARRRLAGFARTLRDNGFKVGLAETRDALAILQSPAGARRSSLKPALRALFAATRSDWEHFDEVFDAYWSGTDMRRKATLSGQPAGSAAPLRRLGQAAAPSPHGLPDHVERRAHADGDDAADPKISAPPISATSPTPTRSPRCTRSRHASLGRCERGSCAASKRAGADNGSTSAAPSIAACRRAARRSIWSGAAAR